MRKQAVFRCASRRAAQARELGVRTVHVRKLVLKHGLPHLMVGDIRRYELGRVLEFLRARGAN